MNDRAPTDDAALVDRANRGETGAFEELYRRHRDWVVAIAYRFTGNRDDALDVLQDVFAYFFGKFPGFVLTASLRSFLYPAVKHTALGRKRKEHLTEDLATLADQRLPVAPAVPSEHVKLVAGLPDGQREVVLLRFVDDLTLGEIAAALEIPLGTVKSRLHLALAALRETHGSSREAAAEREAGS